MTEAIYTRSTGAKIAVASMPTSHLKSAFAKLAREFAGHPELSGMAEEIASRDAEFAKAQADFEHTASVADHQLTDPFA